MLIEFKQYRIPEADDGVETIVPPRRLRRALIPQWRGQDAIRRYDM
jgi:hypothetical protein